MDKSVLRSVTLWTTIVSGVMTLLCGAGFQVIGWLGARDFGPLDGLMPLFSLLSGVSFLFNIVHTLALLLLLGLIHRDLHIAERWAGYARDYLIRDTTGGGHPGGNPSGTEKWPT